MVKTTQDIDRDELIGELDLALAALRRVIVRAIQNGAVVDPSPIPATSKPAEKARDDVTANGITVKFNPPSVTFASKTAHISGRQAELIEVLAMHFGYVPRNVLTDRAWRGLTPASAKTMISGASLALSERLAPIGLKLIDERGYGVRLSAIEEDSQ